MQRKPNRVALHEGEPAAGAEHAARDEGLAPAKPKNGHTESGHPGPGHPGSGQTVNADQQRDDLAQLLERLQAGDEAAWEQMITRLSRVVYSIPRRLGLSHSDSEEVLQETLFALFRRVRWIHTPNALLQWAAVTARRQSWFQLRMRPSGDEPDDQLPADWPSPAELLTEIEQHERVRGALASLPLRCRELLEALYFRREKPSYDELSGELRMPRGSIGPTRQRCMAKLSSILETERQR